MGSIATVVAPIVTVVSCGADEQGENLSNGKATITIPKINFLSRAVAATENNAPTSVLHHVNFTNLLAGNTLKTEEIKNAINNILHGNVEDITFNGTTTPLSTYKEKEGNPAYEAIKQVVAELNKYYPTLLKGVKEGYVNVPNYDFSTVRGDYPKLGGHFELPKTMPKAPEHTHWEFSFSSLYQHTNIDGSKTDLWSVAHAWQFPSGFDLNANPEIHAKAKLVVDLGYYLPQRNLVYDVVFGLPTNIVTFAPLSETNVVVQHENTDLDHSNGEIHINGEFDKSKVELNLYDSIGTTLIKHFDEHNTASELASGDYKVKVEIKEGVDAQFLPGQATEYSITIKPVSIYMQGLDLDKFVISKADTHGSGSITIKEDFQLPKYSALDVYQGRRKLGTLTNEHKTIEHLAAGTYKLVSVSTNQNVLVDPSVHPLMVPVAPVDVEASIVQQIKDMKFDMFSSSFFYGIYFSLAETAYEPAFANVQFELMDSRGTLATFAPNTWSQPQANLSDNKFQTIPFQNRDRFNNLVNSHGQLGIKLTNGEHVLGTAWFNTNGQDATQVHYQFTFDRFEQSTAFDFSSDENSIPPTQTSTKTLQELEALSEGLHTSAEMGVSIANLHLSEGTTLMYRILKTDDHISLFGDSHVMIKAVLVHGEATKEKPIMLGFATPTSNEPQPEVNTAPNVQVPPMQSPPMPTPQQNPAPETSVVPPVGEEHAIVNQFDFAHDLTLFQHVMHSSGKTAEQLQALPEHGNSLEDLGINVQGLSKHITVKIDFIQHGKNHLVEKNGFKVKVMLTNGESHAEKIIHISVPVKGIDGKDKE